MKMTKELLEQLGSCGDYVRTFIRKFPTTDERFKDGVEVTAETCVEHTDDFNWNWAADVMLTSDAYTNWSNRTQDGDELKELRARRDQLSAEHRDAVARWRSDNEHSYGEPNSRTTSEGREAYNTMYAEFDEALRDNSKQMGALSARVFGELFEDVTNQSQRLNEALERVATLKVDEDRRQLRNIKSRVRHLKSEHEHWTTQPEKELKRIAAELAEVESQLPELEARNQQHDVTLAQARAATAQRALEVAELNAQRALEDVKKAQEATAVTSTDA